MGIKCESYTSYTVTCFHAFANQSCQFRVDVDERA
jgi:hypothetical protein